MAKLSNAVKKMEKLGTVSNDGQFYRVEFNDHSLVITRNGRDDSIATISTCGLSMESERDSMTDYFPETFHDNFKQAVDFIGRQAA